MKEVREISRQEALPMIMDVHYAGRAPSMTYRYGLFKNGILEGICTYGTKTTPAINRGFLCS